MNRSVSRAFPLIVLAGLLAVGLCCAGPYEAPKTVRGAGEAEFTVKPQARRAGKGVEITFAVSAATDVEVAIVDADGNVVRHIAAGLLGENAPAPFQKGALKQTLRWDGKDDAGKPVAGSSRVRVRLGVGAKFNRFIPKQVSPPGPVSGLGVGPDGTVYARIRSYYSAYDRYDTAFCLAGLGVVDPETGFVEPLNPLAGRMNVSISDEVYGAAIAGRRLLLMSHNDTLNTLSLDKDRRVESILNSRDGVWLCYARNVPFLGSTRTRFLRNTFDERSAPSMGPIVYENYVIWVGGGVIGVYKGQESK